MSRLCKERLVLKDEIARLKMAQSHKLQLVLILR